MHFLSFWESPSNNQLQQKVWIAPCRAFSLFLIKMHVRPDTYWSLVIASVRRRANCQISHSRRTQRQFIICICRLKFLRGAALAQCVIGCSPLLPLRLFAAARRVDARLAAGTAFVCLSFSAWVSIWICVLKCKQSPRAYTFILFHSAREKLLCRIATHQKVIRRVRTVVCDCWILDSAESGFRAARRDGHQRVAIKCTGGRAETLIARPFR